MANYRIIDAHLTTVPDVAEEAAKLGVDVMRASGRVLKATPANLIAEMTRLGIESSVIWCVARNNQQARLANEWIASVVADYPGRFTGFACVYPLDYDGALTELDYAIGKLGLRGVKVHSRAQGFALNSPTFLRLVKRIARDGLPLVLHVNIGLLAGEGIDPHFGPNVPDASEHLLADLLDVYDSPRVMAAHMGGALSPQLAKSSISFQTTGASQAMIQEALRVIGSHRVVFGSDFPSFPIEQELNKVLALDIQDDARQNILSGNLLSILGQGVQVP